MNLLDGLELVAKAQTGCYSEITIFRVCRYFRRDSDSEISYYNFNTKFPSSEFLRLVGGGALQDSN